MCCINESITEPSQKPDPNLKCGLRNTNQGAGDQEKLANFSEFPWVVAIFANTENTEKRFIGGGSILTPNMVLTAAHIVCINRTSELIVRAGEWDTQTESEPYPHQERDVLERICHENFNSGNLHNDIAVLNLRSELYLNHHIMPICLPRAFEYPVVERCLVAGWGKETFMEPAPARNILRKVDLPILNHSICQQQLRKTRLSKYFDLHESFTCAGGEKDLDSCTGDGGSPLFCPIVDHPGQYFQLGIVAWGLSCNTENVPAVYANVLHLLPWIHNILSSLSANPNYYSPTFKREYYNRHQEMSSTNQI
ncbi:hypothetical protein ACLKA7_003395 [Drosophila subpalustris]